MADDHSPQPSGAGSGLDDFTSELEYYRKRAAEERRLAVECSDERVAEIHAALAERYEVIIHQPGIREQLNNLWRNRDSMSWKERFVTFLQEERTQHLERAAALRSGITRVVEDTDSGTKDVSLAALEAVERQLRCVEELLEENGIRVTGPLSSLGDA